MMENCRSKTELEIDYIRGKVPEPEILAQLAEELCKAGQAALNVRRIMAGVNPTPVDPVEAWDSLYSELADVAICMEVLGLGLDRGEWRWLLDKQRIRKVGRWAGRLEAKEHGGTVSV